MKDDPAQGLLAGLFDPPRARRSDPDTSHEAADSMGDGGAAQQRLQIMRLLVTLSNGNGMNAGEIDAALLWPVSTAGRRMCELRRAGLVRRDRETHLTPVGRRRAYVYVVTVEGRQWLEGSYDY
jgi:DNA-binding MarR family transcriptional regulator